MLTIRTSKCNTIIRSSPRLFSFGSIGYTELASNGLGLREAWARKLLAMEDGVVNVWPELPEHNGQSI